MVAVVTSTSLSAGYRQYLHFVGRPRKPLYSKLRPKIGCHGNLSQHCRTPSKTRFLGPIREHNLSDISIGSVVLAQMSGECPYTFHWDATPLKLTLPMRESGHHLIHGSLGPCTRVLKPNGISIGSAFFSGLTIVTDRPTDRPRYSVSNNRPHLLRCGLKHTEGYIITGDGKCRRQINAT